LFVLDTNTIRYGFYEPDKYPNVVANLLANDFQHIWISVVTAEELLVWRLRPFERSSLTQRMPKVLTAYENLFSIMEDICSLQVKPFDRSVWDEFRGLWGAVSTNDRRIAATALAHDFTVVSHDGDFQTLKDHQPRLKLVDWFDTPPTATATGTI